MTTRDRIPTAAPHELTATLAGMRTRGVDMVELSTVDNAGIARSEGIPLDHLDRATRRGVETNPWLELVSLGNVRAADQRPGGPGGLRLVPDLTRLRPMSEQQGWAWAPADKYTADGTRHSACQRHFARRQTTALAETGVHARIAFAHPWYLFGHGGDGYFGSLGSQVGMEGTAEHARGLISSLRAQGIEVDSYRPGMAPRPRLSTSPTDPLTAADDTVLVRHTTRQYAPKYGLAASFSPVISPEVPGVHAPLRLSLHNGAETLHAGDGPHGLSPEAEAFAAGILAELPALVAIGAGSAASFVGAEPAERTATWGCSEGDDLRVIPGLRGSEDDTAGIELTCFDATANPYLLVGAVLAAGAAGVRGELRLPDETGRRPQLPTTTADSAEALANSEVLAEAMGEELHAAVVAVRRCEAKSATERSPEEIINAARMAW